MALGSRAPAASPMSDREPGGHAPKMGDKAARIRGRVLDAAVQCLLSGGFGSARLHTAIAGLAGLSRPTVYKYVGDQDAIIEALIDRELAVFIERLEPVLQRRQPRGEQIVNVLVFVVHYAREHPLLGAAASTIPDQLLPWFTTHAGTVVERIEPVVEPYFRRYIDEGELPDIDPRVLMDAVGRMALSLIFTTGIVDLSGEAALRDYVTTVVRAVGQPHPVNGRAPTRLAAGAGE